MVSFFKYNELKISINFRDYLTSVCENVLQYHFREHLDAARCVNRYMGAVCDRFTEVRYNLHCEILTFLMLRKRARLYLPRVKTPLILTAFKSLIKCCRNISERIWMWVG